MSAGELPARVARRDCLVLLYAVRNANLRLTQSELHAMCYFARILSCSTEILCEEPLPYEFTFGKAGGPYSSQLNQCLSDLEEMGLLRVYRQGTGAQLIELVANEILDALISVDREFDLEDNDEHLLSLVSAAQVRSIAKVVGAILQEPSLVEARRSGLRDGMPLPQLLIHFRRWLAELRAALAARRGKEVEPGLLVPLVLDVLDPMSEVNIAPAAG